MGCDIHLHVERRDGGKWISAETWEPDEDEPERLVVPYQKRFYTGRNYNLFAMLADVRNGRGFAGAKTGDEFNPIAHPKGLPEDVCSEVKADSEMWGEDGHSHSHSTVAELLAYDWTQTTVQQGYLSLEEFAKWVRRGRGVPDSSCGWIGGPNIRTVELSEGESLLATLKQRQEGKDYREAAAIEEAWLGENAGVYVLCQWSVSYCECATGFLSNTMPRLWRLGKPEDVRIVFWFDN